MAHGKRKGKLNLHACGQFAHFFSQYKVEAAAVVVKIRLAPLVVKGRVHVGNFFQSVVWVVVERARGETYQLLAFLFRFCHVAPENDNLAAVRLDGTHNALQRSGFACAVLPDKSDNHAFGYFKRHVVKAKFVKAFAQICNFQHSFSFDTLLQDFRKLQPTALPAFVSSIFGLTVFCPFATCGILR